MMTKRKRGSDIIVRSACCIVDNQHVRGLFCTRTVLSETIVDFFRVESIKGHVDMRSRTPPRTCLLLLNVLSCPSASCLSVIFFCICLSLCLPCHQMWRKTKSG